jgi:hypothetical protein
MPRRNTKKKTGDRGVKKLIYYITNVKWKYIRKECGVEGKICLLDNSHKVKMSIRKKKKRRDYYMKKWVIHFSTK